MPPDTFMSSSTYDGIRVNLPIVYGFMGPMKSILVRGLACLAVLRRDWSRHSCAFRCLVTQETR